MQNNLLKVYIVQGWKEYANWLPNHQIVNTIEESDLVLFCGGEDVSPFLYGEPKHPYTYNNAERDEYEIEIFKRAQELNKQCLGVCRGSQFLCVMAGGKLVQHQENPLSIHLIFTHTGDKVLITSTHHQAQWPYNLPKEDYRILAWTHEISETHQDGKGREMKVPKECEIVYYPQTNSLGIQGHPEMIWDRKENYKETFNYLHTLLNDFINGKLQQIQAED